MRGQTFQTFEKNNETVLEIGILDSKEIINFSQKVMWAKGCLWDFFPQLFLIGYVLMVCVSHISYFISTSVIRPSVIKSQDPHQKETETFFFIMMCMCVCMLSHFGHVQLFVTPWTVAHQAPLSMGLSRQEYQSGMPCPPPGDLPDRVLESASPVSSALQADSLPLSHWGSRL